MSKRTTAFVIALALAGTVDAQAVQSGPLTDAQVARVDAAYRAEIRAIGDSAIAAGLPADAILQEAFKGRLNKSSREQVLASASSQLRDMRASQGALGAGATHADIKAAVHAIRAGVDPATLRKLATEKHNAALFVTLSVLSDLVVSGVPVDTAERMVGRLVVAGVQNADLTSYRDLVRGDIALGSLPAASATSRGEATILRSGNADFTAAGPGQRANGPRRPIPPEEN
jgi:hypothetical protein